jgi:uracil DNA glycosylase
MEIEVELSKSDNGREWLKCLPDECVRALSVISSRLSNVPVVPLLRQSVLPFHLIHPSHVRLVVLCKEPYASESMATGVPVETASGMETPSANYFLDVIRSYWADVSNVSVGMRCYYASGILVLNSSATIVSSIDKRYTLALSHFSLWATFMRPLVRYLLLRRVPIVALGAEAKQLVRNIESHGLVQQCAFPSDPTTAEDFYETLRQAIDSHVYDRSHATSATLARTSDQHTT